MAQSEDLRGQRFGSLTVIGFAYTRNGKAYWRCRCTCNAVHTLRAGRLTNGKRTSCWNCTAADPEGKESNA